MKRIWLTAGIIVLIFSTGVFAQDREEKDKDYVIGKIGRESIYISEVDAIAQRLDRFSLNNYKTNKEWRYNFIRNYIAQTALAKRAQREGLDKDEKIVKELKRVETSLLAEKILKDTVSSKMKVGDKALKDFYEENKERYRMSPRLKLSYVKDKNRKSLERIISLLAKGRDFQKAAGKKAVKMKSWVSKDSYAVSGQEFLSPTVLSKLEPLRKGLSSAIMEIEGEFYIFHIEDKEPARHKAFEEVRRQVELEYATREKERIVTDLVVETFEKEKVEIYDDKIFSNTEKQDR